MIKKIKFLLIGLIVFSNSTIPVYANTADLTKNGSIEITLKEANENMINGAEITIYHIADAINVNNNLTYSLRNNITGCNVNLDNLTDTDLINQINKCNLDNANKYTKVTNTNGIVSFNNLKLGLYIIKQTNKVKGYSNIDSFLIAIPTVEDNTWIYDIKSKPKADIYKEIDITIQKKWNSHSKDLPNEVTIELYNDKDLIDSIKLNENNNWTFTFENLKLSDKYNVKEVNIPKGYTPSYKEDNYIFTITNTDTLATTGQIFYPIIIFAILGIILILTGIRIIKNEV